MLNSANDYRILDMTGLGSFVTGAIMPVRSGAAKRALRYEDLLFLREGKRERQEAHNYYGLTRETPPSRILSAYTFNSAQISYAAHFVNGGQLPSGVLKLGSESGYNRIVRELGGQPVLEDANVSRFGKFDAGNVAAAHRNLAKLKRTVMGDGAHRNEWYHSKDQYIRSQREGDPKEEQVTYDVMMGVYYSYSWRESRTHPDDAWDWYSQEVTAEKGDGIMLPWPRAAWMYIQGRMMYYQNGEKTQEDNFLVYAGECTIGSLQNGFKSVVAPTVDMKELAQTAAAAYNVPFREGIAHSIDSGLVELSEGVLVIDHDFPATPPGSN